MMKNLKFMLIFLFMLTSYPFAATEILLKQIGHIDGNFNDVSVWKDKLYTISDSFLKIYDIANPSSPVFLTSYDTKTKAVKVDIYQNYAYVADGKGGAMFLNIADINDIYVKLSYHSKEHQNYGVVVKDNVSYEADGTKGVNIVDISDPYNAYIISTFDKLTDSIDVDIKGDYLYVADGEGGLKILNISNIRFPYLVKSYDIPGFASAIKIKDNFAFITNGNSLVTIDISNPFSLVKIPNNYTNSKGAKGIDIKDDYIYIAKGDNGIDILKINYSVKENEYIKPFVELLYEKILGREADKSGLNFWIVKIQKGMTATRVAKSFFESKEFQNLSLSNEEFIKKAYETLLNRKADPKGLQYWKRQMDEGVTKEQIFYGFAFSKEFENLAKEKYHVTPFDQTDKLEAFVGRFYNLVLNRSVDPKGKSFWVEALKSKKKSPSNMVLGFFNSKEFKDRNLDDEEFIKTVYKAILGRDADKKGLNFWILKLKDGKKRLDIVKDFYIRRNLKESHRNMG